MGHWIPAFAGMTGMGLRASTLNCVSPILIQIILSFALKIHFQEEKAMATSNPVEVTVWQDYT